MIAIALTILIAFLATTLFGHVVHWALHQKWTGSVNQSHMTHHLKLYPPSDYLSDSYRHAGKDDFDQVLCCCRYSYGGSPYCPVFDWIIELAIDGGCFTRRRFNGLFS